MFRRIAQECYMRSVESFTKLFEDKEFYRLMMEETGRQMYEELKIPDLVYKLDIKDI